MRILKKAAACLRTRTASFRRGERGNVAMLTGFMVVTMTLAVGGSVDLYNYETERRQAQTVVDRCVLAGSRASNGAETDQDIQDLINDCVQRQGLDTSRMVVQVIENTANTGVRHVRGTYRDKVPTSFMRLARINDLSMSAVSEARDQEQYAEVSLVLDLSASMTLDVSDTDARRRIDLMRVEAAKFVRRILANGGDVSTSINLVPYSQGVNIGKGMFDHLATKGGLTRNHDYTSCALIPFNSGEPPSVSAMVNGLRQLNPFIVFDPLQFHTYSYEDASNHGGLNPGDRAYVRRAVTDGDGTVTGYEDSVSIIDGNYRREFGDLVYIYGGRARPSYGGSYGYKGADEDVWVTKMRGWFPDKDTTGRMDGSTWSCAQDPHAYMLKPYLPQNARAAQGGNLPFVNVGGVDYPLYERELYDHITECDRVNLFGRSLRFYRKANNGWSIYYWADTTQDSGVPSAAFDEGRPWAPGTSSHAHCLWNDSEIAPDRVSRDDRLSRNGLEFLSPNGWEANQRGDLKIDNASGQTIYLSNDADELAGAIERMPVLSGTATDQAAAWGYALLDPEMRDHIADVFPDRKIGDEQSRQRPRDFFSESNNIGTSLPANSPARKTKKYLIILSDGVTYGIQNGTQPYPQYNYDHANASYYNPRTGNTVSKTTNVYSSNTARTQLQGVCDAADANGIIVYTIAFAMDDETGRNAMTNCASSSETGGTGPTPRPRDGPFASCRATHRWTSTPSRSASTAGRSSATST